MTTPESSSSLPPAQGGSATANNPSTSTVPSTSSPPSSSHLQASAKSTLVSLVEEYMTALIRESVSVQRHCKRARLHHHLPDESTTLVRRRIHADHVNMALQWQGSEKLYAIVGATPTNTNVVHLQEYLQTELEMKAPHEVGLTQHWLAVDGSIPELPQNVTDDSTRSRRKRHTMDETLQDDGDSKRVHVHQLLPQLLSEELQLYFRRVTLAVERGQGTLAARQQQDAALQSLAKDSGLQELVPFWSRYISQQLYHHTGRGNASHCRTLVRMFASLLRNPHLHLELQLQQLLPAVMTCIVAKRLSQDPNDNEHWALRIQAAQTVVMACQYCGDDYPNLKPRMLKTLLKAVQPQMPLPTQFGGLVAISLFGPKALDAFLLRLLVDYWNRWDGKLSQATLQERNELHRCQQGLLIALSIYLQQPSEKRKALWENLEDAFGDRMVELSPEPTDYALCFI